MARHALKTPVLVGIAAIAVTIGAFALEEEPDDVHVVIPPCDAAQGEFCLQLELHEDPHQEDANRHFDVVAIEGGWTEIEAAFAGLDARLTERVLVGRSTKSVHGLTQADFDSIPAAYRVKQAKDELRLHLATGNYFVCAFIPPKPDFQGRIPTRCIYIVYGEDLRMDGNTYFEFLRTDEGLYGMERE